MSIIYEWCGPRLWISGGLNNPIKVESRDYSEGCLNWVCHCGHIKDAHHWLSDACYDCDCKDFKYYNNDRCAIECQMIYKLYEQTEL